MTRCWRSVQQLLQCQCAAPLLAWHKQLRLLRQRSQRQVVWQCTQLAAESPLCYSGKLVANRSGHANLRPQDGAAKVMDADINKWVMCEVEPSIWFVMVRDPRRERWDTP